MAEDMICGGDEREFSSGNGTVKLLKTGHGCKLLITPEDHTRAPFERDYAWGQEHMAERDYETIYRAIWG